MRHSEGLICFAVYSCLLAAVLPLLQVAKETGCVWCYGIVISAFFLVCYTLIREKYPLPQRLDDLYYNALPIVLVSAVLVVLAVVVMRFTM